MCAQIHYFSVLFQFPWTSQTKPVVKRRSNMTKSIHHGAFRCWKVLLQLVDSASFYTVHTVCVCTKPAAASLPVRGLSHTRTMRLKDLLHLKDCCRLRHPPRPLTSDLWTLKSLQWFNKRLSGSRGNLASQKSSLTSYMDVKIRTELLFLRSVCVCRQPLRITLIYDSLGFIFVVFVISMLTA